MVTQRRCLGRRRVRPGQPRARLGAYLQFRDLAGPSVVDWSLGLKEWGMLFNDQAGLCTIAAALHQAMLWNAVLTGEVRPYADQTAKELYVAVTAKEGAPWDPATGANDNGAYMDDVFAIWLAGAFPGAKIDGYLHVDTHDIALQKFAAETFGGLQVGLSLPESAEAQLDDGTDWTVYLPSYLAGKPGGWGEHQALMVGADEQWVYYVTWGKIQRASVEWHKLYLDDAAAPVYHPFLNRHPLAGRNLALADMRSDLARQSLVV